MTSHINTNTFSVQDPAISIGEPPGSYETFDLGQTMDVWVKRADGTPTQGKVRNKTCKNCRF